MACVQVLSNNVCLLQLDAGHDNTAVGCLLQCMFYPSSEESKVDFVHVCRSKHEEATMIIVDDCIRERIRLLPSSARTYAADGGEPWSVLTVHLCEGANEVGVLLRIATALNATAIPMMNISTFDSNYVIVPTSCCSIAVERCIAALNDPNGPPSALMTSTASGDSFDLLGSASIEYGSSYSLIGIPFGTLPEVMYMFAKVLLFERPNADFMSFTRHGEQSSSFASSSLALQLRSLALNMIPNYCCLVLRPQTIGKSSGSGVREVGVIASYTAAFAREGISVMNLSSSLANFIFFSRADADESVVQRLLHTERDAVIGDK